jgi:hypothetical protein
MQIKIIVCVLDGDKYKYFNVIHTKIPKIVNNCYFSQDNNYYYNYYWKTIIFVSKYNKSLAILASVFANLYINNINIKDIIPYNYIKPTIIKPTVYHHNENTQLYDNIMKNYKSVGQYILHHVLDINNKNLLKTIFDYCDFTGEIRPSCDGLFQYVVEAKLITTNTIIYCLDKHGNEKIKNCAQHDGLRSRFSNYDNYQWNSSFEDLHLLKGVDSLPYDYFDSSPEKILHLQNLVEKTIYRDRFNIFERI